MSNKIKFRSVLIKLFVSILFAASLSAQEFKVVDITNDVKYRTAASEVWNVLEEGIVLQPNDFIVTGLKSSVKLKSSGRLFNLEEFSAVPLSSIKPMSTDELLLALAMEDMINAPKKNSNQNSSSTAVYGDKEEEEKILLTKDDNFGTKRLNGAMQLAKSGYKESAIVFAKETYRKYPDSKKNPAYRIFFADILNEIGLYEEALGDYLQISKLNLSKTEKSHVDKQIKTINQILLNN